MGLSIDMSHTSMFTDDRLGKPFENYQVMLTLVQTVGLPSLKDQMSNKFILLSIMKTIKPARQL